jgi:hypothetical protein
MELLDLANCDRAVRTIEHAFYEPPLRIARPIRKLWHAKVLLPGNLSRSFGIV